MRLTIMVLTAVLLIAAAGQANADQRRDGAWWVTQDESAKQGYLTGLEDGVAMGGGFSAGVGADPGPAYVRAFNRYLAGTPNRDIQTRLNAFYADPRYRFVKLADAVYAVLKQIAGDPDADAFAAGLVATPPPPP